MKAYEYNSEDLTKLKQGDERVYAAIYRTYFPRFRSFANSYVRDEFVAENIVQDAFTTLWENKETLADNSNVLSYLLTIIKNRALNHLSHLQTRYAVEEKLLTQQTREIELRCLTLRATDPESIFSNEVQSLIRQTLDKLPEQTRQVIEMSRFDNLSNKEIALRLNISVKGVEYHITKGLKSLRIGLKDYMSAYTFFF
ncbi:MAG: RNA polymerase sigma-70 factor [Bacteroidota bacterium]|nr:RNA polymerase sigma-70 factor [Bacteroidota bacterium]